MGEGEAEVVTSKNLIVRLEAPRFFTQKDEVVLSANVHNYLSSQEERHRGPRTGRRLPAAHRCRHQQPASARRQRQLQSHAHHQPGANGEQRVDWRVKVVQPGQATVRMKALSNEESDATQQQFPVYIHGMMKTDSLSGVLRPEQTQAVVPYHVPAARLPELEPAGSALLAHAGRRHGRCAALHGGLSRTTPATWTLDRFLPTVLTQHILLQHGAGSEGHPRQADQSQRAGNRRR